MNDSSKDEKQIQQTLNTQVSSIASDVAQGNIQFQMKLETLKTEILNQSNREIRNAATGASAKATIGKIKANNPSISEDDAIHLMANSRKGHVSEKLHKRDFNLDALEKGSSVKAYDNKRHSRKHTDLEIRDDQGRLRTGDTFQIKTGKPNNTLGRKDGVRSNKYTKNKKFVLDKKSYEHAKTSKCETIKAKINRGEIKKSIESYDPKIKKTIKSKPQSDSHTQERTKQEIKNELNDKKTVTLKPNKSKIEAKETIKGGLSAAGGAMAISSSILLAKKLVKNGNITKDDMKEAGKVALSSGLDASIKYGTTKLVEKGAARLLEKGTEKALSKGMGAVLGKGAPAIGFLINSGKTLCNDDLSSDEKAKAIAKDAVLTTTLAVTSAICPPLGALATVGLVIFSIFDD